MDFKHLFLTEEKYHCGLFTWQADWSDNSIVPSLSRPYWESAGFVEGWVCRGLSLLRAGVTLPALPRPPGGFLVGKWGEECPASPCLPDVGHSPFLLTKERKWCLFCGGGGQWILFLTTCHYFTVLMANMLVRSLPNFSTNIYDLRKHY